MDLDYLTYVITKIVLSGEYDGMLASEIARFAHGVVAVANDLDPAALNADTKTQINHIAKGMVDALGDLRAG